MIKRDIFFENRMNFLNEIGNYNISPNIFLFLDCKYLLDSHLNLALIVYYKSQEGNLMRQTNIDGNWSKSSQLNKNEDKHIKALIKLLKKKPEQINFRYSKSICPNENMGFGYVLNGKQGFLTFSSPGNIIFSKEYANIYHIKNELFSILSFSDIGIPFCFNTEY